MATKTTTNGKTTNGQGDSIARARENLATVSRAQNEAVSAAEVETNAARQALVDAEAALHAAEPDDAVKRRADVDRAAAVVRRAERREQQARVDREHFVTGATRKLIAALAEAARPDAARSAIAEIVPHVLAAESDLAELCARLDSIGREQRERSAEIVRLARTVDEPTRVPTLPEGQGGAMLLVERARLAGALPTAEMARCIGELTGQPWIYSAKVAYGTAIDLMLRGTYTAHAAELVERARAAAANDPKVIAYHRVRDAREAEALARSKHDCDPCEATRVEAERAAKALAAAREEWQRVSPPVVEGGPSSRMPTEAKAKRTAKTEPAAPAEEATP